MLSRRQIFRRVAQAALVAPLVPAALEHSVAAATPPPDPEPFRLTQDPGPITIGPPGGPSMEISAATASATVAYQRCPDCDPDGKRGRCMMISAKRGDRLCYRCHTYTGPDGRKTCR